MSRQFEHLSGRIVITGGTGLLGTALKKQLPDAIYLSRKDCDLRNREETRRLFTSLRPEQVIHLAAEVGGVKKNAVQNADLFTSNVLINTNVLSAAQEAGVSRLISVLSSCAYSFYPDRSSMEADLHEGMPFPGNLGYGYAKRMLDIHTRLLRQQYGVQFATITPATMYGPGDRFDLEDGHVIGALLYKCYFAKEKGHAFEIWGSGEAIRQFIYAEDVAQLLVLMLDVVSGPESLILAPTEGVTIRELATEIAAAFDFKGELVFDSTKPSGARRRVMKSNSLFDLSSRFDFTPLGKGLKRTVEWFLREIRHREVSCNPHLISF